WAFLAERARVALSSALATASLTSGSSRKLAGETNGMCRPGKVLRRDMGNSFPGAPCKGRPVPSGPYSDALAILAEVRRVGTGGRGCLENPFPDWSVPRWASPGLTWGTGQGSREAAWVPVPKVGEPWPYRGTGRGSRESRMGPVWHLRTCRGKVPATHKVPAH